ncbi:membrane protein [Brucella anthropi]|uniref:MAPEG family protein n=1 Tax=Brucella anthropi TaxID=529 RepID=UPI0004539597|nr:MULTISPECIES: MAPEG family protein [Brucella]EXL01506.1 membrane protein [Brucella anthropi]WKT92937.1 MAPEG family protein [Brucella anthropi]
MTIELIVLALGCILGVAQTYIAAEMEGRQYGMKWALSSREAEMPPWSALVGRLKRAQANYMETFPIAAAAILIVVVTEVNGLLTAAGAIIWLVARIAFWVVYAIGIPVLRSVLFATSIVGIGMILWPALF